MDKNAPRIPTEEEYGQLAAWLLKQQGGDPAEVLADVKASYAAVWDNYITDGPGYFGRVMVVVWTGSPSIYNVFTFHHETGVLEEEIYELCSCRS